MSNIPQSTSSRYLKRDSKAKTARRCRSLPEWCIVPKDRPLFACRNCGFANAYGELCLWCKGFCGIVYDTTAKRRRISAPQLLNDVQKEQLHLVQRRVAILRVPRTGISPPPGVGVQVPQKPPSICPLSKGDELTGQRRRRHRDATVYTIDGKAAAVHLATHSDNYTESVLDPNLSASLATAQKLFPSAPEIPLDREEAKHDKKQSSPESLPRRTLRRRKRISLVNKISLCSLRATITHATAGDGQNQFSIAKIDAELHVNSEAAAVPTSSVLLSLPLGHPGRPLYTAIRKNMFPAPPSSLSASQSHFPPVRAMSVHSMDGFVHVPSSASRISGDWVCIPSFYPCTDGYGFSLSGETELRMALARQNVHGTEFKYQETKRIMSSRSKIKKIGKSIKDFFASRHF